MKKIEFGNVYFEGSAIVIEKTKVKEKSDSRNIEIHFDKEHQFYIVTAETNKHIYVCSQENGEKTDVFLCEVDEEQEIDEELISSLEDEVLDVIEYSLKNFYIDHRKNQYTGDRNFFLFLKKGSYKSKEISKVEYISNNILVR